MQRWREPEIDSIETMSYKFSNTAFIVPAVIRTNGDGKMIICRMNSFDFLRSEHHIRKRVPITTRTTFAIPMDIIHGTATKNVDPLSDNASVRRPAAIAKMMHNMNMHSKDPN